MSEILFRICRIYLFYFLKKKPYLWKIMIYYKMSMSGVYEYVLFLRWNNSILKKQFQMVHPVCAQFSIFIIHEIIQKCKQLVTFI